MGMVLLAWFTGLALGVVFLALKPWFPTFVSITSTIYQRANMIASGKMFVANTLPSFMVSMFDWNPLFHCIDQSRGYVFINYAPRNSSLEYPIWFGIIFLMIGLMGEFYTRRHASLSWSARR
jgi:ABC-type polysaccharide/polyol phosphate export permease